MTFTRPSRFITAYFAIIGVAGAVAAGLGLAFAWDGSWLAFNALDHGRPYILFDRWIGEPIQLPLEIARRLTSDIGLLSFVYGLAYFAVPVVCLAAAWFLVRRREPRLFVWAALGIGLISLPGQAFVVSEGIMAVQLTWPLFLAVLARSLSDHRLIVAALGIALVCTAPTAIPLLLGLAAATAIVQRLDRTGSSRARWWIVVFLGLAAAATVRSVVSNDIGGHAVESSIDVLALRLQIAVLGRPLVSILLVYLAGALLVSASAARRRGRSGGRLDLAAVLCAVGAGTILVWWSLDPHAWANAFNYRTWLPFVSVPVLGLAFLDARLLQAGRDGAFAASSLDGGPARQWLAISQAVATLLVLATIGLSWHDLSGRLEATVAARPSGCVARASIGWISRTALDHWSLTAETMLLSGRQPRHIVLPSCAVDFSKAIHVTPWASRRYSGGWFDMSALRSALVPTP
jgi:hypothetical protein